MMYFVKHLQTYAAKNRACQELRDYVEHYENVLVKDEISLDAIKEELRLKVNQINVVHPKLKPIRFSSSNIGNGTFRMDASIDKMGFRTLFLSWIYAKSAQSINLVRIIMHCNWKEVNNECSKC